MNAYIVLLIFKNITKDTNESFSRQNIPIGMMFLIIYKFDNLSKTQTQFLRQTLDSSMKY